MLDQYVLSLRESFEAVLVTFILVSYLTRVGRKDLLRSVLYGILLALVLGIVFGIATMTLFTLYFSMKELFEVLSSLLAVAVLTYTVVWFSRRNVKKDIEEKAYHAIKTSALALTLLSFFLVFREAVELLLFLTPFFITVPLQTTLALFLGILSSALLGYLIFMVGLKINMRKFFFYTSLLLILIASSLLNSAFHELTEVLEDLEFSNIDPIETLGPLIVGAYLITTVSITVKSYVRGQR